MCYITTVSGCCLEITSRGTMETADKYKYTPLGQKRVSLESMEKLLSHPLRVYYRALWWACALLTVTAIVVALVTLPLAHPPRVHTSPFHYSRFLPVEYWRHRVQQPAWYAGGSCSVPPLPLAVEYSQAAWWQRAAHHNISVYVYSAHWDARPARDKPTVVIMMQAAEPLPTLYCQLWYINASDPRVSVLDMQRAWSPPGPRVLTRDRLLPLLATCPAEHPTGWLSTPVAVSVATSPCEHTANVLAVQGPDSSWPVMRRLSAEEAAARARRVAVCAVVEERGKDAAVHLVRWIESLLLFGVHKIFIYYGLIDTVTSIVLDEYALGDGDQLELSMFAPPPVLRDPSTPAKPPRDAHVYNDCLYRNAPQFGWLLPLRVGELVVPATGDYHTMLQFAGLRMTAIPVEAALLQLVGDVTDTRAAADVRVSYALFPRNTTYPPQHVYLSDMKKLPMESHKQSVDALLVSGKSKFSSDKPGTFKASEKATKDDDITFQRTSAVLSTSKSRPVACARAPCRVLEVRRGAALRHELRGPRAGDEWGHALKTAKGALTEELLDSWRNKVEAKVKIILKKLELK